MDDTDAKMFASAVVAGFVVWVIMFFFGKRPERN